VIFIFIFILFWGNYIYYLTLSIIVSLIDISDITPALLTLGIAELLACL